MASLKPGSMVINATVWARTRRVAITDAALFPERARRLGPQLSRRPRLFDQARRQQAARGLQWRRMTISCTAGLRSSRKCSISSFRPPGRPSTRFRGSPSRRQRGDAVKRILVTPRSLSLAPPPELEPLRQAGFELVFSTPAVMPDEAELIDLVPGCVGWLAASSPVSGKVIAAADSLRRSAATAPASTICRSPCSRDGASASSRPRRPTQSRGGTCGRAYPCRPAHIPTETAGIRAGGWPRSRGKEIAERQRRIIGCGRNRKAVATRRLGDAGQRHRHDPFRPNVEVLARSNGEPRRGLRGGGHVSLHCPAPADGRPIVDCGASGAVPPHAILINTARRHWWTRRRARRHSTRAGCRPMRPMSSSRNRRRPAPLPAIRASSPPAISAALTDESVSRRPPIAVANLLSALEEESA